MGVRQNDASFGIGTLVGHRPWPLRYSRSAPDLSRRFPELRQAAGLSTFPWPARDGEWAATDAGGGQAELLRL